MSPQGFHKAMKRQAVRDHVEDVQRWFDAVIVGEPEGSVPQLIDDLIHRRLQPVYRSAEIPPEQIRP